MEYREYAYATFGVSTKFGADGSLLFDIATS
jgi:hypothetical protein